MMQFFYVIARKKKIKIVKVGIYDKGTNGTVIQSLIPRKD